MRARAAVVFLVVTALLPGHARLLHKKDRMQGIAGFLSAEAQRIGSVELLEVANNAQQPDAFGKVKDLISHMIAQHMTAQAEATDHKAFCDKEMGGSKKKIEKLQTDQQKNNADLDMKKAQLAELKDSIGDLHEEVAKAHKSRQKATEIRQQEADAYEATKKDADTAVHALSAADFDDDKARAAAEKAEEERITRQVHAENQEQDRQFKFKKLDGEIQEAMAAKTKEVELKERKVIQMNHEIVTLEGDIRMRQEELDASNEYFEKIKTTCTVKAEPHEDRKRRR